MLGTLSRPLGKPGLEVPTASRYEYRLTHTIYEERRETRTGFDDCASYGETTGEFKKKKNNKNNSKGRYRQSSGTYEYNTRTVSKISNHPCPSVSVPSCRSRGSPLLVRRKTHQRAAQTCTAWLRHSRPGELGRQSSASRKSKKPPEMESGALCLAWLFFSSLGSWSS